MITELVDIPGRRTGPLQPKVVKIITFWTYHEKTKVGELENHWKVKGKKRR